MRRTALIMSAMALVLGTADLQAQGKNFAGSWTLVPDANAPATGGRGGGRGFGPQFTISQDAKTVTVTSNGQNGEVKRVYNLDGSESKNTMSFGGNAMDQMSTTKWDGDKFVVMTKMNFNGNAFETSMNMMMDSMGMLVVESTSPGRDGGAPTTTKMMYKKTP